MKPEDSVGTKCYLSATGDLTVQGQIEGKIDVENALTVEPGSQVAGPISARVATIRGAVHGNVTAREEVVLVGRTGSLQGDIVAPRLTINDGAHFLGAVNSASSNGDGNGGGNSDGNRDAGKHSPAKPAPMREPKATAEAPVALLEKPSQKHDERKEPAPEPEKDAVRGAEEAREATRREPVQARPATPPAPAPATSHAAAPSGQGMAPSYWGRGDPVATPPKSPSLFGHELRK